MSDTEHNSHGLVLHAVTKTFCQKASAFSRSGVLRTAVKDVSFSLPRPGVYGLVGESGSGKTTIARMIAGLEQPSAGSISLDGAVCDERFFAGARRRVQMVFQNPYASLDPRWRVGEIIAEGLSAAGYDGKDVRDRVLSIMHEVALASSAAGTYPHQLSGGERQRVALARSLVLTPDVLVLDEPTASLDVSTQKRVLDMLKNIWRARPCIVLFISHDIHVIHYVADHVFVMKDGSIVESGPVADIMCRPQNAYTQELVRS